MTDVAFRRRCKRAVILGSISGAVVGIAACIAFGVLDVQCRNSPAGPYWNAEAQACQTHEVGDHLLNQEKV